MAGSRNRNGEEDWATGIIHSEKADRGGQNGEFKSPKHHGGAIRIYGIME
jgi:hypothetical protein